jgi:membrane peptidoglycan carboxypeptidase
MSMPNGPQKIIDMAYAMGIPESTKLPAVPSVALGFASVSPVTMANAYATIADGGLRHDWFTVSKVTRASDGEVLYTAPRKTTRALDEDIASDVSYALQQTVKGGTGQAALQLGRAAAGKTGTATRDDGQVISSWFVGYTPQVSTAVMYVRGNGRKSLEGYLEPFYGASYPARTWTAVMRGVMEGLPEESFPPPARVDGKAPDEGHAPAKPTKKPKPTKTATITPPTNTPPSTPTNTPTPTNTQTAQEPVANGVCSGVKGDPDCNTPDPSPTCSGILCREGGTGSGRHEERATVPGRRESVG